MIITEAVELRTDRLRLAAPTTAHTDAVLALALDPDIALWNPLREVADLAGARAWCLRNGDWSDGTHATFLIHDAATDAVLGNIAVHSINGHSASAELGYRTAPQARGRGVAGEAVRTVAAWAFEAMDLVRLELAHAVDNPASCRVAEKAGFRHEGTLRSSYRYGDGRLHDEHVHGRLVTDPVD